MSIKAIIFDFGGVITRDNLRNLTRWLSNALGTNFEKTYETILKILPKYDTGKITEQEFWRILKQELSLPKQPESYHNLWYEIYKKRSRINRKVEKIVLSLKKQGYQVALLSNTIEPFARANKEKNRYKIFSPIILSCELGIRKPAREIYELMLRKLGRKANECIYIDNSEKMLKPAEELGMKTILFMDAKQLKKDLINLGIKIGDKNEIWWSIMVW